MTFNSDVLLTQLETLLSGDPPLRWLVAFSGGIDSTVLLHALARCRDKMQQSVLAVHIDHGLHPESAAWEGGCRQIAADLGVQYLSRKVAVATDSGSGPEAAARQVRYAAIQQLLQAGDCLLSAHHEDDQAETLLLNLMRGSGPAGLAGIAAVRDLPPGRLLRPMLGIPLESIVAYAARHDLAWIEDPSNADTRFDRNYLRNEIMPRLASRWPAVAARLKQSADLAGESSELLNDLADLDIESLGSPLRLALAGMREMSPPRQRNVLRRAIRRSGLPPAPASRLYQAVNELVPARQDAQPVVIWPGAELRRYQDFVFVLPEMSAVDDVAGKVLLINGNPLDLGPGMGALGLEEQQSAGIDPQFAASGLEVRYRQGGEEIRLAGHECTHKLKKLLQQESVLPWMRARLPLLYAADRLVAVADLWVAADCVKPRGYAVCWHDRPILFT